MKSWLPSSVFVPVPLMLACDKDTADHRRIQVFYVVCDTVPMADTK